MVSSFDVLSTVLPMSTITFSSAMSDDEDDITTLDHPPRPPPKTSSFCDASSSCPTLHHQQHTTPLIDQVALSERSLFEDPTRRIYPTKKIDYAPMAPPRQQQQQEHVSANPKWTTSPSPPSGNSPVGTNMDSKPGFIDQAGCLDVKPRMPTRSSHRDDEDHVDCNKKATIGNPNNNKDDPLPGPSQTLVPSLSVTRRDRLVQRLAAVHRIVEAPETTTGGCRIAPIFDMSDKADPPKLPIRTTHDDMTESVISDDDDYDSGGDFACDVVEDISRVRKEQSFDCVVVVDDDGDGDGDNDDREVQIIMDEQCPQLEESVGSTISSCSSQEKKKQPNSTSKQRKKKQKGSKAATPKSSTTNKKKAAASKEADPQESLTTKTSIMDPAAGGRRRSTGSSSTTSTIVRRAAKGLLRPRSKEPPERFATAPASLSSSTTDDDSNRKNYIAKRRVRTRKSSSSERRNRRQFVSNSLASILEDENENTTSPVREEPKAPVSCPAAIETSGLEERYDSILDLENRFPSKARGGRSWAGTASRNLL